MSALLPESGHGVVEHPARFRGLEYLVTLSVNFGTKKRVFGIKKVSTCFDLKWFSNCLPSL